MENYDIYPTKPHIERVKIESNWGLTAFSLVLFVGVFLLLFKDEIDFVLFLILVLFIHEMGHFTFMKLFNFPLLPLIKSTKFWLICFLSLSFFYVIL